MPCFISKLFSLSTALPPSCALEGPCGHAAVFGGLLLSIALMGWERTGGLAGKPCAADQFSNFRP